MQRHTLLTLCAAAVFATSALGLATAKPASLMATMSWKGTTSRDWNVGSNWSGSTVPVAGDIVTIPRAVPEGYQGDPIISNADGLAGDLTIASNRTVTVTGKKLTLDLAVTHDIDGEIRLSADASVLKVTGAATLDITGKIVLQASGAVLDLDADVTASGTGGEIEGQDDDAQIQIATDTVLMNSLSIVGNMKVVGETGGANAGKLDNRGAVVANADGILKLGLNLLLVDTAGSGRWEASGEPTAVLLFSNAHTCTLKGNFRVGDCATLRFNADIDTEGSLSHDATNNKGTIDVNNGATFGYSCNTDDPCVCTDITSDRTLGCP